MSAKKLQHYYEALRNARALVAKPLMLVAGPVTIAPDYVLK